MRIMRKRRKIDLRGGGGGDKRHQAENTRSRNRKYPRRERLNAVGRDQSAKFVMHGTGIHSGGEKNANCLALTAVGDEAGLRSKRTGQECVKSTQLFKKHHAESKKRG